MVCSHGLRLPSICDKVRVYEEVCLFPSMLSSDTVPLALMGATCVHEAENITVALRYGYKVPPKNHNVEICHLMQGIKCWKLLWTPNELWKYSICMDMYCVPSDMCSGLGGTSAWRLKASLRFCFLEKDWFITLNFLWLLRENSLWSF